jgi:hypothetical protein
LDTFSNGTPPTVRSVTSGFRISGFIWGGHSGRNSP